MSVSLFGALYPADKSNEDASDVSYTPHYKLKVFNLLLSTFSNPS
jgi:hypothetical protein